MYKKAVDAPIAILERMYTHPNEAAAAVHRIDCRVAQVSIIRIDPFKSARSSGLGQ
ncbi:MAG TPA: hypothetical protein VJ875_15630 [Pyrinomonadaceae bacterium]|nr:hypothetical protein [Pyrinomonadaceae bacterium]